MFRIILLILSIFLLYSCTRVKYIEKPIYIKCKIPEIPTTCLNNVPKNASYSKKLQIILNNCLKLEKENKLLREAIKTCQ